MKLACMGFVALAIGSLCNAQEQPQRMPVKTDQSENWKAALTGLQQELNAPIAVYIGERTLEAPNLKNLHLSPDLRFISLASRLRGVYRWSPHFHIIAADLRSKDSMYAGALALVDFLDTLNGQQMAELYTSGVPLSSMTVEQIAKCAPLFMSEQHLESVLTNEPASYVSLRTTPTIVDVERENAHPREQQRKNVVSALDSRALAAVRGASTGGLAPSDLKPAFESRLPQVTESGGTFELTGSILSLQELADLIEAEFDMEIEFDPRIAHNLVFIHGKMDQATAIALFSQLANTVPPQIVNRNDLNMRIESLIEKAMEHWNEVADLSTIDLNESELQMFLEGMVTLASALDRGTGRFQEFFDLAGINYSNTVRLDVALHWQLSSIGEFVPRDSGGNALTIESGTGRSARTFGVTVANGNHIEIQRNRR